MDHTTHRLAPIPMDDRIMALALQMKQAGLPWEPEVGCFVWDREGIIAQPSPFPKRIYFILSMQRFLAIFGDQEKMKRHLVWLPTWYQARQVLRRLRIADPGADWDRSAGQSATGEAEMIHLYQRILQGLRASGQESAGKRHSVSRGQESGWIRAVMISDLGDVTRLPVPVQRRIEAVYREVACAYLGWRRIQEGQADDWLPPETAFDNDLLCELGHFYSDYQKSIQSLDRIRKVAHLLGAIDPHTDRENFDRLMSLILERDYPQSPQQNIMNQLTTGEAINPVS
ncbi:uncharacterized protein Dvar_70600 [Desulfosarcina variabilis str. Montpellier]|uniref:hypothetical protein n=1 Tax=Desulfosarcina variabilis TaxID=2300 RepID=UPI003AFA8206